VPDVDLLNQIARFMFKVLILFVNKSSGCFFVMEGKSNRNDVRRENESTTVVFTKEYVAGIQRKCGFAVLQSLSS